MSYTKSTFSIPKMDCPSEENLIRLKLKSLEEIESLDFDINNRTLIVYHHGNLNEIDKSLQSLKFDSRLIDSHFSTDKIKKEVSQSKLLWQVLIINLSFFIIEITMGILSNSMGLVADSLDMLADTFVYGLSIIAVGGTLRLQKNVAKTTGVLQTLLALIGIIEVLRRFLTAGETPVFLNMIIVSIFALIANYMCLRILNNTRSNEVHIQASKVFTSNDIVINIGVILAGILVYLTDSKIPDLIIGTIVFIIVLKGALTIFKIAKTE